LFTKTATKGGVLHLNGVDLDANSCTFRQNRSPSGSAVYISNADRVTFSDCLLAENVATDSATLSISKVRKLVIIQSIFYLNVAEKKASCIKLRSCKRIQISITRFLQNTVTNGTTVSISRCTGDLNGVTFAANKAGGVTSCCLVESKVVITVSKFIDGGSASIFASADSIVRISSCRFAASLDHEILSDGQEIVKVRCESNVPIVPPEFPILERITAVPKKAAPEDPEPDADDERDRLPAEEKPEGSRVVVIILVVGLLALGGFLAFGRGRGGGTQKRTAALFVETKFDPSADFENGIGPEDFHFDAVPEFDD
jgi:hypothetical protein